MLCTTTSVVEGRRVREYRGLVMGEAILGANVFRDFFAGIRDIVGGRSGGYEKALREARQIAIGEMEAEATRLGANAVHRHRHRLRDGRRPRLHADGLGLRHGGHPRIARSAQRQLLRRDAAAGRRAGYSAAVNVTGARFFERAAWMISFWRFSLAIAAAVPRVSE